MTALTEGRYTKHRDGLFTAHPVKGGQIVYKGSLVRGRGGFAYGNEGDVFLGVSIETADNSGNAPGPLGRGDGTDGSLTVRTQCSGIFSFAQDGTVKSVNIGCHLFIADNQTLSINSEDDNGEPRVCAGKLEAMDGTDVWCRIKV